METTDGVLIPGQVVNYTFEQFGDMGVMTVPNPKSINVLSFFINRPLDSDQIGASLSYSTPPDYSGMNFIGAIGNQRPSDIFHPGFALNPNVNTLAEIKLIV